ncbi:MAG: hypothetical protein PHH71_02615, partial [Clostridia bacterium]|nr:hypothetical protein [Clostridia bacterium]
MEWRISEYAKSLRETFGKNIKIKKQAPMWHYLGKNYLTYGTISGTLKDLKQNPDFKVLFNTEISEIQINPTDFFEFELYFNATENIEFIRLSINKTAENFESMDENLKTFSSLLSNKIDGIEPFAFFNRRGKSVIEWTADKNILNYFIEERKQFQKDITNLKFNQNVLKENFSKSELEYIFRNSNL